MKANVKLPPQPEPDAPMPPPGPEALRSRAKMRFIWWLGGAPLGLLLSALLAYPYLNWRSGRTAQLETLNTAEALGAALAAFESEYGRFPDAATAREVKSRTGTALSFGDADSNALFRQMLAARVAKERTFYAAIEGATFPDENVTDVQALTAGECGFGYVPGLSPKDDPATPVAMSPLIPGTFRFDRKPFGSRAILLHVDGSAEALPIDDSGRVIWQGLDLFDPRQPFWQGKTPDLKWQK